MQRRSFIASILAASTAPAFVHGGVLMPIATRQIWTPPPISDRLRQYLADGGHMPSLRPLGGTLRIYTGTPPLRPGDPPTGRLLLQRSNV